MFEKNMNKRGQLTVVLAVIVVLLLAGGVGGLWYFGGRSLQIQQTALAPTGPVELPKTLTGETLCPGVSGVTVTLTSFDKEEKGTATGERSHLWIQNGVDESGKPIWKRHTGATGVADAGTTTVGPGKKVMVLFGNQSEVQDGSAYLPSVAEFQLGCTDETLKGEQKDRNSSAITVNLFSSANADLLTGGNTEDVSANSVSSVKMSMKSSSQDYFGDGFVKVVFNVNTTAFDTIYVDGFQGKGTLAPGSHSGVAGARAEAYELPALFGASFVDYTLVIDTTSSQVGNNNITGTVYDRCLFINADTNLPEYGYTDEDNNELCSNNQAFQVYVS